jgi:hypothetical protein
LKTLSSKDRTNKPIETDRIIRKIKRILTRIINEEIAEFRKTGIYKVRPGYKDGDKFYLDSVEGSYEESLQLLIHYILFEEGIYAEVLTERQLADAERVVRDDPDCIYSPGDETQEDSKARDALDHIYWECIVHVAKVLKKEKLRVEAFAGYF